MLLALLLLCVALPWKRVKIYTNWKMGLLYFRKEGGNRETGGNQVLLFPHLGPILCALGMVWVCDGKYVCLYLNNNILLISDCTEETLMSFCRKLTGKERKLTTKYIS